MFKQGKYILIFKVYVNVTYRFFIKLLLMYDCSMVAAFGSGVMFSLVSGMGGPNQATNVITSGVFFALVQGGLFKVIVLLCVGVYLSFVRASRLDVSKWLVG